MTRLVVRPIVFTDRTDEWLVILRALGLHVVVRTPGWVELASGSGRIALHPTGVGQREGSSSLGFETDDLDAFLAEVTRRAPDGLGARMVAADHGTAVEVTGRDGMSFLVDLSPSTAPVEPPGASTPVTVVRQLWVSPEVPGAAADLEALGLRTAYRLANGRGVELAADEGRVFVHIADDGHLGAVPAVDYDGNLDDAHAALLGAGVRHDVIDETHGRTLKVPMPGCDQQLWVTHEDEEPAGAVRV